MEEIYEVNNSTLAVIAIDENSSRIIEKERDFIVNTPAMKIIENSCSYFGSSYNGRYEGTKRLTGISYKSPIIIEESTNMIFFPTASPRITNCSWISLNNIMEYKRCEKKANLVFYNGYKLELDVSFNVLENQIMRATRLDSILRKRKIG